MHSKPYFFSALCEVMKIGDREESSKQGLIFCTSMQSRQFWTTRGSPLQNPHRQVPLQALKKSPTQTLAASPSPRRYGLLPSLPLLWPLAPLRPASPCSGPLKPQDTLSHTPHHHFSNQGNMKEISAMNIGHLTHSTIDTFLHPVPDL